MNKLILGGLISSSFALLILSVLGYFITIPIKPEVRNVKTIEVLGQISNAMDVKDKVIVKKTINNTNYLNSWKLSATVLGTNSFAMVLKGKKSKVLKLKDTLEGYEVKKIEKDKILFSTLKDDVWLYIKTKKVIINNPGISKVMPRVGIFNIRQASFKRNVLQPEKLLKTINVLPEMNDGVFQGMRVSQLLEGSFLYMNGLRKGDVIKKINRKRLVSLADGIAGYQNIATSKKFSISVLRDSKIKELKYEIVK